MPIKSLQNSSRPALPRLGKLRKGGKKPARGLGRDLNHFRFTADGEDAELERVFHEIYGEEPDTLRVYLPYADVESNFGAWMEAWAGGERLLHRCDGEYCVKWLGDDGRYVYDPEMAHQHPCPFGDNPDAPNRCREVGRLQIILPGLWEAGYVGLVMLETHSVNDIVHIDSVLRQTLERSMSPETGLRGIEFILRRKAERIHRPAPDGGRIPTTKWLVKIEPTPEWLLAQLEIARRRQMGLLAEGTAVARPQPTPAEAAAAVSEALQEEHGLEAGSDVGPAREPAEGTPAEAAAWLSDRARVDEVLGLAKRERLSRDEVLRALGVGRLGEITYGFDEARSRILGYRRGEGRRVVAEEEVAYSP